jgi:hypothetical protein
MTCRLLIDLYEALISFQAGGSPVGHGWYALAFVSGILGQE